MTPKNKTPLTLEIYKERRFGRYSWRLRSGNRVKWAGPHKGFYSIESARRSFWRMVEELGGDPAVVVEKVIGK